MADQAGDCYNDRKYSYDFKKEAPHSELREAKFEYPSSMEAQIRKLKLGLENWKEIVLHVKKVCIWEKQWHSTALIGGSTILFTFLWLLDPSILTVVSVFGLVLTLSDYLVLSIANSVFKAEKWTTRKDQEFEEFCTNVVLYKARFELAWAKYYKLKATNRKLYFLLTISILGTLAWIGCTFNNLFLAYLLTTFLLLLPGMEHNGIITKWWGFVQNFFVEFMRHTKSKVGQEKND